jgi:hypothetical protein
LIVLVTFFGWISLANADHDPNIIHACIKNKAVEVVSSPADCKQGEVTVALATEEALNALQGSNEDLKSQLDALTVLTKRLHGNKAAVLNDIIAGSGTVNGTPGGFVVTMVFCDSSIVVGICDETTGLVLKTGPIGEGEEGSIITFDAGNSANFGGIAALVTNGQDDLIEIETLYFKGDGSPAGGGSITARDSSYFFRRTQTTTGPGFDDLTGLEIDRIDISVDRVLEAFNSDTQQTTIDIDYRIFFGLAP